MMCLPLVTVLMPVFNAELYLEEAIESILNQTYTNFEFLIINDGSTDRSEEIIMGYADKRIRYIKNEENINLIASLNKGLALAKGDYIARMDADDVCHYDRLKLQIEFLITHPNYGLVGSWGNIEGKSKYSDFIYPVDDSDIRFAMTRYNPFLHSCVTYSKKIIVDNSLSYNPEYAHCEDYELWSRLIFFTKVFNIPELLITIRMHDGQVSNKFREIQIENTKRVGLNYTKKLGLDESMYSVLNIKYNLKRFSSKEILSTIVKLNRIDELNSTNNLFSISKFKIFKLNLIKNLILEATDFNFQLFNYLIREKIFSKLNFTIKQKLSFLFKVRKNGF